MKYIRKLPDADEIIDKYSLNREQTEKRAAYMSQIEQILIGKSTRKLLLAGPCSADREDAVLDYILRLAELQEKVSEQFLIVPRVYTSKPRTNGSGYKGLLHRPTADETQDNLCKGIIATRMMHLHVIQQTGMFCVDEMLYPESIYYILDLLVYLAVGARSVEDQAHKITASGVQMPVGMKNPISGDLKALLNSITVAQSPQSMIYRGWEVQTEGNSLAHAILRGYVDKHGKVHPNYHYEDLCDFRDQYQKANLKYSSVIVDCNHGNSAKRYNEQVRIAREVIGLCSENESISNMVKGIMLESYIEDDAQIPGGNVYGKSITDSCLGWKETENLILKLDEILVQR